MTTLYFHPFPRNNSMLALEGPGGTTTFVDPITSWSKSDVGRIIYKDSAESHKAQIRTLDSTNDTLYIIGQCKAGLHQLHSIDLKVKIEIEGLLKQLDGLLDIEFPGKVKIFACYSGLRSGDNMSFTYHFAKQMNKYGWESCRFFGYDDRISMFAGKVHKGDANLTNKTGQHKWGFSDGQRAKFHRIDF